MGITLYFNAEMGCYLFIYLSTIRKIVVMVLHEIQLAKDMD